MADLWATRREATLSAVEPLAVRMRPRTLAEFVGQAHIVGASSKGGALLRKMIEAGRLTSIILHGPPGTGKTTLAQIIARESKRPFVREHAASVGVARIREIVADSCRRIEEGGQPVVLFLDEIHRFTRAQQDVLLDDVERGRLTLIGATTENPMFTVNAALVSRSTVFRLEQLTEADIMAVLRRTIADSDRGLGARKLTVTDDAIEHWAKMSEGDARRALTALEVAVLSAGAEPITIDLAAAEASIQRKHIVYDRKGDQHYDHASAIIKSIRGSDPDAALYWLALMIEAGEDPRFIARRLAILASEDIGNADPHAAVLAASIWTLIERIGMPEGRILLGQLATYLALAPKSNAAYTAIDAALEDVREGRTIKVPTYLRDGHKVESVGTKRDARGYDYAHSGEINTSFGPVTPQPLLDESGKERIYYEPKQIGFEKELAKRIEEARKVRRKGGA